MEASETGIESGDEHVLNFLGSMERYLILQDGLSSTLRQGWLELASARHSMGSSRVTSTLFDHKVHRASTTLQLDQADPNKVVPPHFTLCKWASFENLDKCSEEKKFIKEDALLQKDDSLEFHHHELQDDISEDGGSKVSDDNHAQKERLKSLSMFGTLVSPKLRSSQTSFEKALEILVEIANVRASLLQAHDQVNKT